MTKEVFLMLVKKSIAEALGTFVLVVFGCGSAVAANTLLGDAGQGVPPARTPSASVDGRDVFASETADYLSDHWRAVPADGQGGGRKAVDVKGTEIAQRLLDRTLTLSGMHFQDADTLDLTRTKGCCVHVIDEQCNSVPLCIYYLTSRDGQRWDYAQGA